MRCFVGIELPHDTRAALAQACETIRTSDERWRAEKWVPSGNLHVTLAFLGDVDSAAIPSLMCSLDSAFAETTAFELPFGEFKAVPSARRASMIWASYRDPEGVAAGLARSVAIAAAANGIAVQERKFVAHVTLVRARRPHGLGDRVAAVLDSAARPVPGFLSVRSATLFASTLTRTGPLYDRLRIWEYNT